MLLVNSVQTLFYVTASTTVLYYLQMNLQDFGIVSKFRF